MLPLLGESFNTISLFAFILVLGIVVDDAVIVGESVDQCRRQGMSGRAAAVAGAHRVARPLLFAVLTTLVAFAPLLFLPGPEGALMRVIPIVSIAILLLSLVESLWILPSHLAHQGPARGWMARSRALAASVNAGLEAWLARRVRPLLPCLSALALCADSHLPRCVRVLSGPGAQRLADDGAVLPVQGDQVVAEAVFPEGTGGQRLHDAVNALETSGRRLAEELENDDAGVRVTRVFAEQGVRRKVSNARDPGARYRVRGEPGAGDRRRGRPAMPRPGVWRRAGGRCTARCRTRCRLSFMPI